MRVTTKYRPVIAVKIDLCVGGAPVEGELLSPFLNQDVVSPTSAD